MKRILLTIILTTIMLTLVLAAPCLGYFFNHLDFMDTFNNTKTITKQLTPEQKAEDKIILYIVKETNKQIPRDIIITSLTIKTIRNQIEAIIIKAGYTRKEFSTRTSFCPMGHVHYMTTVISRTQNGTYTLDARYYFKGPRIKSGIGI